MGMKLAKIQAGTKAENNNWHRFSRVFCFVGETSWCSAFRLFWAENMLKHELQQLMLSKQKNLSFQRHTRAPHRALAAGVPPGVEGRRPAVRNLHAYFLRNSSAPVTIRNTRSLPPGGMPGSTAGRRPAATGEATGPATGFVTQLSQGCHVIEIV